MGYKININSPHLTNNTQKIYWNRKYSYMAIEEQQKIKYFAINLTIRNVQNLPEENFKTFLKNIKAHLNHWKYIICSWTD